MKDATDVGFLFYTLFISFSVFLYLKIIIYITLKFMHIFILIEKCIMNKFCYCKKFQFITVLSTLCRKILGLGSGETR
jgi:hypothetical protein